MPHTVPFSRKIDEARDFERQALGEVLDEIVEHAVDLNPKDIRNGRLSAEALEQGQPERMDVLFRTRGKNDEWISIAMQVTEGAYLYAGTIRANGSQLEITDDVTNGFCDLVLSPEGARFKFNGREYRRQ
jgi:hypothetical protein